MGVLVSALLYYDAASDFIEYVPSVSYPILQGNFASDFLANMGGTV